MRTFTSRVWDSCARLDQASLFHLVRILVLIHRLPPQINPHIPSPSPELSSSATSLIKRQLLSASHSTTGIRQMTSSPSTRSHWPAFLSDFCSRLYRRQEVEVRQRGEGKWCVGRTDLRTLLKAPVSTDPHGIASAFLFPWNPTNRHSRTAQCSSSVDTQQGRWDRLWVCPTVTARLQVISRSGGTTTLVRITRFLSRRESWSIGGRRRKTRGEEEKVLHRRKAMRRHHPSTVLAIEGPWS